MIVIYGNKDRLNAIKPELSDTIHKTLQEVLGLPEDKRAHRFIPMDKSDFYAPGGRTDAYTVIELNLMAGRSKEVLTQLIHKLFSNIESDLNIQPIDIEIIIKEQPAYCWGFRGMTGEEALKGLSYKVDI